MKKYLSLMAFAMIAVFGLAFVSCDDDDEMSISNGEIEINGVKYKTTTEITMEGSWNEDGDNEGSFTVAVLNNVGGTEDVWYETFYFESDKMPKEGDDFAQMSLTQSPMDDLYESIFDDFSYVSGSAKVKSVNKSKGLMTISFNNLKTKNKKGTFTYTFNGTVSVSFNFER